MNVLGSKDVLDLHICGRLRAVHRIGTLCDCWTLPKYRVRHYVSSKVSSLGSSSRLVSHTTAAVQPGRKEINTEPPAGWWAILQLLCSQAGKK